jgi:hypothetical protein
MSSNNFAMIKDDSDILDFGMLSYLSSYLLTAFETLMWQLLKIQN